MKKRDMVEWRDGANRKRTGIVDRTSRRTGARLVRVDGKRWFDEREVKRVKAG